MKYPGTLLYKTDDKKPFKRRSMTLIPQKISARLSQIHNELNNKGELFSKSQLEGYLQAFRDRFAPDVLNNLNGKPVNSYNKLDGVMRDDIFPLVEEYCYEDYQTILKILGQSFVDEKRQRIRGELFEADMKDDFIQALKSIDPTLDSSSMAVQSEAEQPEEEDE